MTSISKNVYIDTLADLVTEYNHTFHRTIKLKPINVKPSNYIYLGVDNNDKNPKFEVGDHMRMSNIKTILQKVTLHILPEEVFVIKKVKDNVPQTYEIEDLNSEEFVGMFYKKEIKQS